MPRDQEQTPANVLAFRSPQRSVPKRQPEEDVGPPVIMGRGWYHQEAIDEDRDDTRDQDGPSTVLNVDFKRD